jgi:hypothetical protein
LKILVNTYDIKKIFNKNEIQFNFKI